MFVFTKPTSPTLITSDFTSIIELQWLLWLSCVAEQLVSVAVLALSIEQLLAYVNTRRAKLASGTLWASLDGYSDCRRMQDRNCRWHQKAGRRPMMPERLKERYEAGTGVGATRERGCA